MDDPKLKRWAMPRSFNSDMVHLSQSCRGGDRQAKALRS